MRAAIAALAVLLVGAASGFAAAPPQGKGLTPGERRELDRRNEQCLKPVAAGEFAEAAESVRKAVAIRERRQGKDHWETVDLRLVQQRWASLSDLPEKDRRKLGTALGQAAVINRLIADKALA